MGDYYYEVEHEGSGIKAIIYADNHDKMIEELDRIGFKSILKPESQKTHVIDLMIARRADGEVFSAMPYEMVMPILNDVIELPSIDEWPTQKKGGAL
jgi:ribosomal protein L25 (general stress protein Ctc)